MTKPKSRTPITFDGVEGRIPTETYTSKSAIPLRAGAMDAFDCPSLEGGERINRQPPVIISSKVQLLRTVHSAI